MSRILLKDTFRKTLGSNQLNSLYRTVSNPATFTHFWLSRWFFCSLTLHNVGNETCSLFPPDHPTAHSPQHRLCLEVLAHRDLLYCPAEVQQTL